ncbi:MAG TPA: hypothetical protein VKF42_10830 [Chitinivibrionales bacterium]|nr:hypothetical protein [Chitinivibrionales bacterium]
MGNTVALTLFCIVNLLFVIKYTSRINGSLALVLAAGYTLFCIAVPLFAARLNDGFFKRRYALACAAAFTLFFLVALRFIKVDTIMNDRWSVVNAFLDNLLAGVYPYLAQSNQANQPGPFPFYFVIAFPFYCIREIGALTLVAFVGLFAVFARQQTDSRTLLMQTVLLVTSPALAYEIIVRSTVFANMALVVLFLFWLEAVAAGGKRLFWIGMAGGLLLSTRAVAALPLACYLSYGMLKRRDVSAFAKAAGGMAAGFCITFVPLLFWGWNTFTQKNPLFLQSAFSPPAATAAFLALSVAGGLFVRSFEGCLRLCGVLLFLIVAVSTLLAGLDCGWYRGFFESKFDISYFIFCVPFLVASLRMQPEDSV